MNTDDRIAELRAKTDPTEADLLELARLTSETLHAFPSPTALGVANANVMVHRENFRVIENKRAQARRDGYALEVIALDTYRLELLLVSWLVQHHQQKIALGQEMFGRILSVVSDHGFRQELVDRLRDFKDVRNKAIHRLLAGEIRYDDLLQTVDQDPHLYSEVLIYVGLSMPEVDQLEGLLGGQTLWQPRPGS
jgi:hypothetical protein